MRLYILLLLCLTSTGYSRDIYENMGQKIEQALKRGDLKTFKFYFKNDQFVKQIITMHQGGSILYDPKIVKSVIASIERDLLRNYFFENKQGEIKFLRVLQRGDKNLLIFRVLERTGQFAYLEFECTGADDLLGFINIYDSRYTYGFLDQYVNYLKEMLPNVSVTTPTSEFERHLEIVLIHEKFSKLLKNNYAVEAWRQYNELPSHLLSNLRIRHMGLQIAYIEATPEVLAKMYKDFYYDFREVDGGYAHNLAFKYMLRIDDLPTALEILRRIDLRVGGDPYLNYERALILFVGKQYPSAKRYVMKVFKQMPQHEKSIILAFRICCAQKSYNEAIVCLQGLKKLGKRLPMLMYDPEYSDFIQSPEFLRYKQEQH